MSRCCKAAVIRFSRIGPFLMYIKLDDAQLGAQAVGKNLAAVKMQRKTCDRDQRGNFYWPKKKISLGWGNGVQSPSCQLWFRHWRIDNVDFWYMLCTCEHIFNTQCEHFVHDISFIIKLEKGNIQTILIDKMKDKRLIVYDLCIKDL